MSLKRALLLLVGAIGLAAIATPAEAQDYHHPYYRHHHRHCFYRHHHRFCRYY